MSRSAAPFATLLAVGLVAAGLATPAQAWPFGRRDPAPAQSEAAPAAAPSESAAAPARRPATAAERAQAQRLDPLARAVFWGREVEVSPQDVEARLALARTLRELRRFEEAAQNAQQALVIDPTNVEAMLETGRIHIDRGQAFYAIAPLEQAQAQRPDDWRIPSTLGVAYEQVSRFGDARAAWAQALALSPENPAVLTNLALSHAAAGQPAEAEALLRRAVTQPGATIQMRQNLALVLGLQGRLPEAEQIIRRDLPPEMAERNLEWLRRASASSPSRAGAWDRLREGG